jgi:hypothetical protein
LTWPTLLAYTLAAARAAQTLMRSPSSGGSPLRVRPSGSRSNRQEPMRLVTMTIAEARRQYQEFMSRMDVAFAFGHGCAMDGSHPRLRALREEADRLLAQLRTLQALAGERPLNAPGRIVTGEFCGN